MENWEGNDGQESKWKFVETLNYRKEEAIFTCQIRRIGKLYFAARQVGHKRS